MTTDSTGMTEVVQPPSLLVSIVSDATQHLLQILAGVLVTSGVLTSGSQSAQFVQIGLAIVVGALAYGWRRWQHASLTANANARVVQAAATGVAVTAK